MEHNSKISKSLGNKLFYKNRTKTARKDAYDKAINLPKVNTENQATNAFPCRSHTSKDVRKRKSLLELTRNSEHDLYPLTQKPSRCAVVSENGEKTNFELKNNSDGSLSLVLNKNVVDPGEKIKQNISKLKIPICRTAFVDGQLDIIKYSDMNQLIVGSKDEIEHYESATKITTDGRGKTVLKPTQEKKSRSRMIYTDKDSEKLRERLKMKQMERKELKLQVHSVANKVQKLTDVEHKLKSIKQIRAMQKFMQRLQERQVYLRHNQRDQRPVLHLLGKGYSKWKNRNAKATTDNKKDNVFIYKSANETSKFVELAIYIESMLKPLFRSTFNLFVCLSAVISVVADTLRF